MTAAYLFQRLVALGYSVLPGSLVLSGQSCTFLLADESQRTAAEAAAAQIIAAGIRRPRTLYAIRADLAALSAANKNAVWSALTAGTPPLWAADAGPNAAALLALQMLGASATLSAAAATEAKLRAAAMYCQDNPSWLVNPPFGSGISIPGDEAA